MSIVDFFDVLRQDTRYALRTMRKQPVFVLTATLTLALGIGANTAIFTVVNAVLLRPLGYHEPDRLVRISGGATVTKFEEIRGAQSFAPVGAYNVFTESVTLAGADGPEGLKAVHVSANLLSILGVAPLVGRGFVAEEESPGPAVAMIGAGLWNRRFARDRNIAGRVVRLGGVPCTIVGVLPEGFQFPFPDVDVWLPWREADVPLQIRANSPLLAVFARLKPGVGIAQATAEMQSINRHYALTHPGKLDAKPGQPEPVVLLQDQLVRSVRPMLWMLFGAVGFVLAIACANVASLVLARARSRSREFAVRAALGASRRRLTAQVLTESVLLALLGGAFGVLLAGWALQGIAQIPGLELPRAGEVSLDGTVLAFAIALSTVTGVLFGLAPSRAASRADIAGAMKASGERIFAAMARRLAIPLSGRGWMIVCQVALSTILLVGAALLIESLAHLRGVDPGFRAENLLTMNLTFPQSSADTPASRSAFFEDLVQRVESIPGVRSAAVTLTLPMTGWAGTPVQVVGQPARQLNERPIAILQTVTPDYFRTMGIAVRRGRAFGRQDSLASPAVAIVNEAMARRFWPSYPAAEDPIGHSILAGARPNPLEIVGIVADVRQDSLSEDAMPGIYRPRTQAPPMSAMFAVRTGGDPLRFVNSIRAQVTALDRDASISAVKTMAEVMNDSEGRRRGIMIVLTLFAAAGLLLTGVGIYGVIAYSVVQRTREVGIRKALGAQQGDVLRLMLRQALGWTVAGLVLGLGGALAATRVLRGLLFEVSATDPAVFAGVALLSIGVALLASYVPARRALRIEPATALREPGI